MYKEDLALNNQEWLICHKTKPNYISQPCIILLPARTMEAAHLVDVHLGLFFYSK